MQGHNQRGSFEERVDFLELDPLHTTNTCKLFCECFDCLSMNDSVRSEVSENIVFLCAKHLTPFILNNEEDQAILLKTMLTESYLVLWTESSLTLPLWFLTPTCKGFGRQNTRNKRPMAMGGPRCANPLHTYRSGLRGINPGP